MTSSRMPKGRVTTSSLNPENKSVISSAKQGNGARTLSRNTVGIAKEMERWHPRLNHETDCNGHESSQAWAWLESSYLSYCCLSFCSNKPDNNNVVKHQTWR